MTKTITLPALDLLRQCLTYDSGTGVFVNRKTGREYQSISALGYILIRIGGRKGKVYGAHRIAWFMHYGVDPVGVDIDHVNMCRHDNRIENLRLAHRSENKANGKKYKNNTSGYKGVQLRKDRNKWTATVAGRRIGHYSTPEEAHAAYCEAVTSIYGEFANFG